ncbi:MULTISPECIES: group III truncated hemoglobin [unclassified Mesorhizobium]|uniref:group III truncated hemoglobin n=1 Tax=unclassified Mesorhizobium TaxID=325217 RepID=UPI000FD8A2D8|nr:MULTISPECIES: group III truncated hemoglobin [unclassified Mesorhizobium]TGT71952.1 group III truncated hemoglobin [Mesorhizobium sp. M2E.F.Ca.ET.166.01.1.1]TGV99333.1 group III truncated hemoglobin [Mesorhizobium sp. M2E.F.Ca.ET.154.01.1.1]
MSIEVKDTAPVSEQQIRQLVDLFYDKIRADPELGPIFERVIQEQWEPHLRKRSSVMLTTGRYKGQPVAVHKRIEGLEIGLFDRWLTLFAESCAELLDAETAGLFRRKAVRIAESLKLYRPDRPWPPIGAL